MTLSKSFQFLTQIPGLRLEGKEQLQVIPTIQDSRDKQVPAPKTTDQASFDKMIAELRLSLSNPETERA
jgi:hypothetical protein